MNISHSMPCRNQREEIAFSLLEVMIAMALFFMAIFSILDLTSRNLRAAQSLQPMQVDASSLAADISLTNRLEEGPILPEHVQNFEKLYPGYTCEGVIYEVSTNGLFQVDLTVYGIVGKKVVDSRSSILLYRPLSAPRSPTSRPFR